LKPAGESAERFVPRAKGGGGDQFAIGQVVVGAIQPQPALIGVERHVVVFLEPPANRRGLEAALADVVGLQPQRGLGLKFIDQLLDVGRRVIGRLHRLADLAGSIAAGDRLAGRFEEFDVLRFRLPRGARGQAEDAGGLHRGDERADEAGVSSANGLVHFVERKRGRHWVGSFPS
jgi:hypothetical protein